jgi:hypothetical protein
MKTKKGMDEKTINESNKQVQIREQRRTKKATEG